MGPAHALLYPVRVPGDVVAEGNLGAFVLARHPLLLGSGRRLFTSGGAFAALRLVDAKTRTTAVVIATY